MLFKYPYKALAGAAGLSVQRQLQRAFRAHRISRGPTLFKRLAWLLSEVLGFDIVKLGFLRPRGDTPFRRCWDDVLPYSSSSPCMQY